MCFGTVILRLTLKNVKRIKFDNHFAENNGKVLINCNLYVQERESKIHFLLKPKFFFQIMCITQ